MHLNEKVEKLKELIRSEGRVAIAFSGGVDSSFLARVAADVLPGDDLLAVMIISVLLTPEELANARSVAEQIGCRLLTYEVDPLSWPDFIDNPLDRCYYCKKKIYSLLGSIIRSHGIPTIMDGTNLDDLGDNRPGLQAVRELGVKTPLVDVGFDKAEIRQLSRRLQLVNWDRPSSSCLATRIPSGTTITSGLLALVGNCERYLHSRGFYGCRARLADKAVHLELAEGDIERFSDSVNRASVGRFFRELGINRVYVDIKGR